MRRWSCPACLPRPRSSTCGGCSGAAAWMRATCCRQACCTACSRPTWPGTSPAIEESSVRMRGVAVAVGAVARVQLAEQLLEQTGELAAPGLAQLFLLAGEPGHLDHPALAFVGQVAMEGIVAALEHREFAVQRRQFGCHRGVDVVD